MSKVLLLLARWLLIFTALAVVVGLLLLGLVIKLSPVIFAALGTYLVLKGFYVGGIACLVVAVALPMLSLWKEN